MYAVRKIEIKSIEEVLDQKMGLPWHSWTKIHDSNTIKVEKKVHF